MPPPTLKYVPSFRLRHHLAPGAPHEIFFPLLLLATWELESLATRPRIVAIALLCFLALCLYGYRIFDHGLWFRRFGWTRPVSGYWLPSLVFGVFLALWIASFALLTHMGIGSVPPLNQILLAVTAAPVFEELMNRGVLFWGLHTAFRRCRLSSTQATVLAITGSAVGFALSHTNKSLVPMLATVLTGVCYGIIRVRSHSTVCAIVMHSMYNLTFCLLPFLLRHYAGTFPGNLTCYAPLRKIAYTKGERRLLMDFSDLDLDMLMEDGEQMAKDAAEADAESADRAAFLAQDVPDHTPTLPADLSPRFAQGFDSVLDPLA